MSELLIFLPVLVTLSTIALLRGKAVGVSLGLIVVNYIAYYVFYIMETNGPYWLPALQGVLSAFLMILMIGSFGPKISRPTYVTVFALLSLFPLMSETVVPFIIAFVAGNVIAFIVGVRKLRKHEKTTGEKRQELRDIAIDASLDVGILTKQLPSGDAMKDLHEYSDSIKTRMAPAYLMGAILGVVIALV